MCHLHVVIYKIRFLQLLAVTSQLLTLLLPYSNQTYILGKNKFSRNVFGNQLLFMLKPPLNQFQVFTNYTNDFHNIWVKTYRSNASSTFGKYDGLFRNVLSSITALYSRVHGFDSRWAFRVFGPLFPL